MHIKKIAFLLPSLKFGGAERVALNLAFEFKKTGYKVDFILMSNEGEYLSEANESYNVIDLKCDKTYKLPSALLYYLIKHKPTVILSSFWKLNLCSSLVKIIYPYFKLLLWEHALPSKSLNNPFVLFSITSSMFYRFATKVVVISSGVYDDMCRMTIGLKRHMAVIHNPIIPPEEKLLQKKEIKNNKTLIVSVGRLEPEKNHRLLLDAIALLSDIEKIELRIVGDGSLRKMLEEYSKQIGLQQVVKFIGYHPRPYEIIAASDILVLSSDNEGFGNVIIEALYCGLDIVSTDSGGGIHDILLNNKYGSIVPINDKIALRDAIKNAIEQPRKYCDQQSGAQRFTPNIIARQFYDLIK